MAKYQKTFELNPNEIDLIETALRHELSRAMDNWHAQAEDIEATSLVEHSVLQSMNELLAKLHHQKVFYSQVQCRNVPAA